MNSRIDRLNFPALAAAAVVAPAATMPLWLLIGAASDPSVLSSVSGGVPAVLVAFLLTPLFAVVFGWFGALLLL